DDSSQPQYIETVPRRGYRFIAEVRVADETAATRWPATSEHKSPTDRPAIVAGLALPAMGAFRVGCRFGWAKRTKLALAVFSIALVALLLLSMARMPKSEPSIESLAVLPFVNDGADEQAEYVSDGITESLVNKLSQLPGLRVEARSTIFRYKGRDLDPVQIGRDLGVQAVLTGTVAQRGDSLVVQAELVRVSSGAQIWGEHYNRRPADIFIVQEDVARRIAEASHLKISGGQQQHIARRLTEDIEAYDLYLKARYRERRSSADQVKLAIDYFRRAIAE